MSDTSHAHAHAHHSGPPHHGARPWSAEPNRATATLHVGGFHYASEKAVVERDLSRLPDVHGPRRGQRRPGTRTGRRRHRDWRRHRCRDRDCRHRPDALRPLDVATAITIGRGTVRKTKQNLGWAIGYNSLALPIAAGVFAHLGLSLRPEIAAISMSGSSVFVAVNALALKRLHLPRRDRQLAASTT